MASPTKGDAPLRSGNGSSAPEYRTVSTHEVINVTDDTNPRQPNYENGSEANPPLPTRTLSLKEKVIEARNQSDGKFDFVKTCVKLLLGTLGCTVAVCTSLLIPAAMIILGTLHKDHCPKSPELPICFIVLGGLSVLTQCLDLWTRATRKNVDDPPNVYVKHIKSLVGFFSTVLFITCTVLVYKAYEPSYNPSSVDYCNKTFYNFGFWFFTIFYSFILILLFCCCCAMAVAFTIE